MTSWRHSWSAVCAVCRRRVLHRMTAWSPRHRGRVCARCAMPGPGECDYEPAAVLAAITRKAATDA